MPPRLAARAARRTGDRLPRRSATSSARRARGRGNRTRARARPAAAGDAPPRATPRARPGRCGRCSSIEQRLRARAHRRFVEPAEARVISRPQKMFAATVRLGKPASPGRPCRCRARALRAGSEVRSGSPCQRISPRVGLDDAGEDLQQRGLAGAVFADAARAPRPRATSKLTPRSAWTAPNDLCDVGRTADSRA